MQKATHQTLLTSGILQFTWDTKALTEVQGTNSEVENDSPTFIFGIYPEK